MVQTDQNDRFGQTTLFQTGMWHSQDQNGPNWSISVRLGVKSESVSTSVWCIPGFGAGFEIALEPSKLKKYAENCAKGRFNFLRQILYAPNPGSKEIR